MTEVRGKRVLVVGLGRSGRAAARCFRRRGALVTVTDSRPPSAFQAEIPEMIGQQIGLELGLHRETTFLRQDLIVVSPGVYPEPPALRAARQRKITIVPEVEAASWFLKASLVGITGSNGKTTTTALLGKMLKASGLSTFVGGNIGVPLISAVDQIAPDALLVAELSSFQLEAIQKFRPHVAVLLNLTRNHLDRHPSFDAYVQAKAQIFRNQTADDYALLNADDPAVMRLAPEIASRKIFFSRRQNLPDGVFVSNGQIRYRVGNLERALLETRDVSLRGEFNVENVLAATAAACVLGVDFEALSRAVRDFEGVEHRLEYVREIRGVEFYNDSKATSVDATAKALSAFQRGVHLILGGKDKGAPYAPLRPLLEGRIRYVLLIGAAAERIARQLSGAAELIRAGDLETAVQQAFKLAVPGDVVLLSPACASFDQFQDFEHRGRVFKELVERLAGLVEVADEAKRIKPTEFPEEIPSPVEPVESRQYEPQLGPQIPPPAGELGTARPAYQSREVQQEMATGPTKDKPEGEVAEAPEIGRQEIPGYASADRPPTVPVKPELYLCESFESVTEPRLETQESTAPDLSPAEPAAAATSASGPVSAEASGEGRVTQGGEIPESLRATTEPRLAHQEGIQPARGRTPAEWVYLYEVGAEEFPPPDIEGSPEVQEDEFEPVTAEDLCPSDSLEDEAFPFEVRPKADAPTEAPAGAGHSGDQTEGVGAGDAKRESSSQNLPGQSRLPGV